MYIRTYVAFDSVYARFFARVAVVVIRTRIPLARIDISASHPAFALPTTRRILETNAAFLGFRRKARRPDPMSAPTRATARAATATLPSSLRILSRTITRVSLARGRRRIARIAGEDACTWIRIL